MNYIIVIDDETNTINVTGNTEFEWYLTIIDGNFLLEKYSGIGTQSIKINPLPNLGDGLYGKVLLSTNDKSCDNSADANIEGLGFYFNVEPKYITLYRSGDTATINVSSTCTWTATTVSGAKFTMSPTNGSGNNSITITATSNDSFENVPITITDCNGLYETVYVTQKPQQVSSNLLTVNPQYISLSGDKKDFTVTVLSICNDGTDYTVTSNDSKITVTKNGNIINGNVNTTENFSGTITVSNACGLSKNVTIEYTKQVENEHYLWIVSSGNSEVNYTFTSDTTVSYDVLSSSNWYIYDYDSSKVNCSKSGNKINISLGEDKEACSGQVITLKNREGDIAKVIYSLGNGLIVETGVTFTFEEDKTEISVSADTAYTFTACIFAYKTENGTKKKIKWTNKSSAFNMIEGSRIVNSYTGGSDTCQEVTFSATTSTKNSSFTDYTIRLQEQETFEEIKIKVKVDRSNQTNDEGYSVTISPESGNYNLTEDFTVSVTPVYYYNGTEYYIKDDPKSEEFGSSLGGNFDDYKGVSAETTFNGVTVSSTEVLYDSIVYHLNIPNGVTSFTACTTATTSGGVKDTSATACTEITFTSVTENGLCLFQSDVELIESGFESSTQMYSFVSQNDFVCVDYKYEYESGDTNWSNWLTIDDSDCENLKVSFSENESTDERSVVLKFTQTGSNKCSSESILIEFKQYGDGSIFIPAFDYLVVRYFWGATEGDDLDTVTVISALLKTDGTPLTGEALTKYPYVDNGVGWNHGTTITGDADTNRNNNRVVSGASGVYLEHAGDNTDAGNECVYLNFKNLTDEESVRKMLNDGVSKIRIDLYGNWYNQKLNGRLDVSLLAYINGDMKDDPSDTYNFVNVNGTEVLNTMTNARVCTQGSGRQTQYKTQYTHIGYVDYNIKDKSAILVMNDECEEATYELTNALTTTSMTVTYAESTTNSISFNSTKDGAVFTNVTVSSPLDWVNNFTITNTTNPLVATFTVNENTTTAERAALIKVTQAESGKVLNYQIKQQVNTASLFTLSETEELTEQLYTLGETQTTLKFFVLSCKNYNNGNGNRLGYSSSIGTCGSTGEKTEEGDYKFWNTFNIPTTCTGGTIVLTQNETNKQITVNFNRECACTRQETINATVTLKSSTKYEFNGSYYYDVTATAVLNKQIECGSATVTVYYGVGHIDNASFSEIVIPKNSKSGTVTNTLTIGVRDEYDENFPMDCIHSTREGHVITFTNNSCYIGGVITVNVESSSLCQECDCEVTSISVSPTTYKFTREGEDKLFNLKVETSTCDGCTKGYKLYDPNGRLVTAGTGENTVKISYSTAIKGDYKLVADDNTGKTATLSIDKFEAYYILCIRQTEEYVNCYTSTTINCSAVPLSSELPKITYRTRYITGETEETDFIFVSGVTVESDCDWVIIEEIDDYRILNNNTYSSRECTVTYTQPISNKKVYMYVKQAGLPSTYTLNVSGASVSSDSTRAIVYVESLKNEEAYGSLMFDDDDANCDWVGTSLIESLSGGIYKYKFTIEKNTSTSSRSCSITVSQVDGKTKTFTITQEGAEAPPSPPQTDCMKISYTTRGLTEPVSIVFKTLNGTQQGIHSVSMNSIQELCCYGLDGTNLVAECNNSGVTLGGQAAFTYSSGGTASITVTKPHISSINIQNNEVGVAEITMKDSLNNIISILDSNGIPQQKVRLENRGDTQSFGAIFTATTTIDVEYSTNQWCASDSCFVYVTFNGEGISQRVNYKNGVVINNWDLNGFRIVGQSSGSCSGSLVCDVNGYQVIINIKFAGMPNSNPY